MVKLNVPTWFTTDILLETIRVTLWTRLPADAADIKPALIIIYSGSATSDPADEFIADACPRTSRKI